LSSRKSVFDKLNVWMPVWLKQEFVIHPTRQRITSILRMIKEFVTGLVRKVIEKWWSREIFFRILVIPFPFLFFE